MTEFLTFLLDLSVLVFAVASMLSVGFSYTVQEILGPLRNIPAVVRTLVANFVLVPLLAFIILQIIPLDQSYAIGLFLISSAAGAPFLIKLTVAAEQDVAISATLLVLLLPVTVIYLPIVVPLILPDAEVSALSIGTPLFLTMLLPLAAGLFVSAYAGNWAERLQSLMAKISSITLVVLVLATFLNNFQGILNIFGEGAILAAFLVIIGAFFIGYLVGGPDRESQDELGLATGQRNIAAATVVATQAVDEAGTLIMVVVSSLVGLAVLFPIASFIRKREAKRTAGAGTGPDIGSRKET